MLFWLKLTSSSEGKTWSSSQIFKTSSETQTKLLNPNTDEQFEADWKRWRKDGFKDLCLPESFSVLLQQVTFSSIPAGTVVSPSKDRQSLTADPLWPADPQMDAE